MIRRAVGVPSGFEKATQILMQSVNIAALYIKQAGLGRTGSTYHIVCLHRREARPRPLQVDYQILLPARRATCLSWGFVTSALV